MSVTLEDVAAKAGVSRALVSLAMHDSPKVSDKSRKLILDAAAELGYRPNLNARRLASARSDTLGVLLSDLHNPLFAEILDGLTFKTESGPEQVLLASGFRSHAREKVAIESFLSHQVDGIALIGSQMSVSEIRSLAGTTPVVVVGRRIPGVDSVLVDDAAGAKMVTAHLIELGHRHIAHVDGGNGAGSSARRRAYSETMREHGLETYVQVCPGNFSERAGEAGLARLTQQSKSPTAIFAANDLSAMGVLSAARARGIKVPENLSVAGFDNTVLAQSAYVSLTTVDYPRFDMGATARKLIRARLGEQSPGTPKSVMLTPTLIVRGTTSTPPPGQTAGSGGTHAA